VLHSLYRANTGGDGGGHLEGEFAEALTEHLGGFEAFAAQLTAATTSTQGSGWGVLAYEPLGGRLLVERIYDHQGNLGVGSVPLLVFGAWEHAFYLQYKNVKPDYVDPMWKVVNWPDVAARYAAATANTGATGAR